ncbi:MAG: hypothetical protein P9M11_01850 [Candidatus Tenebribacter burtonii]|nr:hypothetical protein [Candidatus Tenebribacter burtonii]
MKNKNDIQKSGPILSGLINIFFDMIKHFIKDFDYMRKVKKIDTTAEKFSALEHMIVRLENKINDNWKDIEELKSRLFWGNAINIVLLLVVIYLLI